MLGPPASPSLGLGCTNPPQSWLSCPRREQRATGTAKVLAEKAEVTVPDGAQRHSSCSPQPQARIAWLLVCPSCSLQAPAHAASLLLVEDMAHYHLLSAAAQADVDLGQDSLGAEPGCSHLEQGEGSWEIPGLQLLQTWNVNGTY